MRSECFEQFQHFLLLFYILSRTKYSRQLKTTSLLTLNLGYYSANSLDSKAGWRVFAPPLPGNLSKLKSVEAAGIETLQLDTFSDSSTASSMSQVQKLTCSSLDNLLNNAGAGYSMPLMDLDLAKARDLFDLNVFSLISTTRAFLPLLMKSTTTHGGVRGGMAVNNTSCSSLAASAVPFAGAYNASKPLRRTSPKSCVWSLRHSASR